MLASSAKSFGLHFLISKSMLVQVLLFAVFTAVSALRKSDGEKILLSKVQSLTLRNGLKTSHRRVSAVPQVNFAYT